MKKFLFVGVSLILTACGETSTDPATEDIAPVVTHSIDGSDNGTEENGDAAVIDAASILVHPDRFPTDAENDERRKPLETLAFMRLSEDDVKTVLEMESGGGYFTELLSLSLGSDGNIIIQNPAEIMSFFAEALEARFEGGRLPNVSQSVSPFDALEQADGSIDLVTWIQGPHELWFIQENGQGLGNPEQSFSEIARVLKPGGAFVAIDHAALEGAGEDDFNQMHRVDPGRVMALAQQAGLSLEASADFLANPDDDKSQMVFAPEIRGQSDQFVFRFRKPE